MQNKDDIVFAQYQYCVIVENGKILGDPNKKWNVETPRRPIVYDGG